ncbi:hypothetical protein HK096_007876 [Nowakowskiella sp. JEL0078]|nr:hypothetical protein HK096_007876 [Nowakowskiella sp. JEL0078]
MMFAGCNEMTDWKSLPDEWNESASHDSLANVQKDDQHHFESNTVIERNFVNPPNKVHQDSPFPAKRHYYGLPTQRSEKSNPTGANIASLFSEFPLRPNKNISNSLPEDQLKGPPSSLFDSSDSNYSPSNCSTAPVYPNLMSSSVKNKQISLEDLFVSKYDIGTRDIFNSLIPKIRFEDSGEVDDETSSSSDVNASDHSILNTSDSNFVCDNSSIKNGPSSHNSVITYPMNIDFLDDIPNDSKFDNEKSYENWKDLTRKRCASGEFDKSEETTSIEKRSPEVTTKPQMVVIRNLNGSQMASAMMSKLGTDCKMQFNHKKQIWEGNSEDDEILAIESESAISDQNPNISGLSSPDSEILTTNSHLQVTDREISKSENKMNSDLSLVESVVENTSYSGQHTAELPQIININIMLPSNPDLPIKSYTITNNGSPSVNFSFNPSLLVKQLDLQQLQAGTLNHKNSIKEVNPVHTINQPSENSKILLPESTFLTGHNTVDFTFSGLEAAMESLANIDPELSFAPQNSVIRGHTAIAAESSFLPEPEKLRRSKVVLVEPTPEHTPSTTSPASTLPVRNYEALSTGNEETLVSSVITNSVTTPRLNKAKEEGILFPKFENSEKDRLKDNISFASQSPFQVRYAGISKEQILSHVVDALHMPDEWAMSLNELDLSNRQISSVVGLQDLAPQLKKLKLSRNQELYLPFNKL